MHGQPFPVIDLEATGKNIMRLRQKKGLTVRDMQGYFRFEEPRAIYKWQSGQSLPTVDNLLALSILLDVSMEDILVHKPLKATIGPREQTRDPVFLLIRSWAIPKRFPKVSETRRFESRRVSFGQL